MLTALGVPLSELSPLRHAADDTNRLKTEAKLGSTDAATDMAKAVRKNSSITFARFRMLYARATSNAKGGVKFGLRHIRMSS